MSITQGEHELQRYGSFTNNIPTGFIQQVYAAAKSMTANGNAKIDTSQSKFGGASGNFDGTNSYLSAVNSADFDFGTGDWTVDFFVRRNGLTGGLVSATTVGGTGWYIAMDSATSVIYLVRQNIAIDITSSVAISDLTWTHVAIVRHGNTETMYFGGTSVGTASVSAAYNSAGTGIVIGRSRTDSSTGYFAGWLDELRISKGIARWTSNFTPPTTEYASDSYTVLLLHMNGANGSTTFIDDSAVDFSISASPTSQSVGAGSTAFYILNLAASGSYTGTVSLTVTSGCPSGVTCTVTPNSLNSFPNTSTLSVPTLITTPGGTTTVTVTGSDGTNTHTAQVSLTVAGPTSFGFNVKSSASQVVVTLMYSWTGSGAPPQGSITLAAPSGPSCSPSCSESGAVVYDRTSISVSGSGNTYNLIHRVTFTITAPSAQVWTAYVSLAGVTSYTLTIEVS